VNSMLSKCIADNQKDWTDHLNNVAFVIMPSMHEEYEILTFFLVTWF